MAAYPCLGVLLDTVIPAVHAAVTHGQLSPREQIQLALLDRPPARHDTLYTAYMQVLDWVGSHDRQRRRRIGAGSFRGWGFYKCKNAPDQARFFALPHPCDCWRQYMQALPLSRLTLLCVHFIAAHFQTRLKIRKRWKNRLSRAGRNPVVLLFLGFAGGKDNFSG